MEKEIWHITDNFLKLKPHDVLNKLVNDDLANYKHSVLKLGNYIALLDDAIAMYIELLQEAYRQREQWKDEACLRAAIAMAASALNYILLERHGILLGYYPETRDLSRACYERTTRCLAFFLNNQLAQTFLLGKTIRQAEIDGALKRQLAKNDTDEAEAWKGLRANYGHKSKVMHPNLMSLEARTGRYQEDMTKNGEVLAPVLGGMMSLSVGQAVVFGVLQDVVFALSILRVMICEETGKWDKRFQKVKEAQKEWFNELKNSTGTET